MRVTLKREADGTVYFDVNDLKDEYDIKKIAYYTVDANLTGGAIVKLYDKNKKIIKPKKAKKPKKKML